MNEKELKGLAKYLRPIIIDAKERGMTSIQLIFGKNHKKQLDALLALLDLAEAYLASDGKWPTNDEIRDVMTGSFEETYDIFCGLIKKCRLAALREKEGLSVEEIAGIIMDKAEWNIGKDSYHFKGKTLLLAQAIHSAYERKGK